MELPPPGPDITAKAAQVVNVATGEVLYQLNPDQRLPPASTTKIVTALVALEQGQLYRYLPVSHTASQVVPVKIGLRPRQKMTVEALLYGTLLYSANDASIVLAEGLGGSVSGFAAMMNRRVKALGAHNSQFRNPHGLTRQGHYSTARDLARIYTVAMANPTFQQIVLTKRTTVSLLTGGKHPRLRPIKLRNKNRLLWNFPGALGGKTGYTRAAGRCFVGAATRNGETLVVAVLGSRSLWRDTRKLLEYGFDRISDDRYIVQVASFRDENQALMLSQRIKQAGYRAYVEGSSFENGSIFYRVRVGPYRERIFAQQAARALKKADGLAPFVMTVGDES